MVKRQMQTGQIQSPSVGHRFELLHQASPTGWAGQEESPYLQEKLGIQYPVFSADELVKRSGVAFHAWRKVSAADRAGILMESLERMKGKVFEIAYATMHTTGQGYMMAFQALVPTLPTVHSKPLRAGYEELTVIPRQQNGRSQWASTAFNCRKNGVLYPKAFRVVGCSTFPTEFRARYLRSLITGNPVIVKPHPEPFYPSPL